MENIATKLDNAYIAKCLACRTPYKRTDARWSSGGMRSICAKCGLDQTSEEAGAIAKVLKRA